MRTAANILRDERGTSLIETALIAPMLAALIVGMVDLSRGYAADLKLEQAAQRAVEKIQRHGYNADGKTTDTQLKADAAAEAGVATSAVTVTKTLLCGTAETSTSWTSNCADGQIFARYVTVSVQGSYTPLFTKTWNRTASTAYTISGVAGIRVQ